MEALDFPLLEIEPAPGKPVVDFVLLEATTLEEPPLVETVWEKPVVTEVDNVAANPRDMDSVPLKTPLEGILLDDSVSATILEIDMVPDTPTDGETDRWLLDKVPLKEGADMRDRVD
jgi:hypothetical protein